MKKYSILLLIIGFLVLTGCKPNLVVKSAMIDFAGKTVNITVSNKGNKVAEEQLTYIEINAVDAPDNVKPQSQYSVHVPAIFKGASWSSGAIHLQDFSSPRGLNLLTLEHANLVVRVDAKNMVAESNENDNLYGANQ
jgi:hypothetical protein